MTEEAAYSIALEEMQSNNIVPGIWAKAMAFSEGDENKAKANYLRFRAEQLLAKEHALVAKSFWSNLYITLMSPNGRIPRSVFAPILFCAFFVVFACFSKMGSSRHDGYGEESNLLLVPLIMIGCWVLLVAHIKRARDAGIPPYWIGLYLFPIVGWFFVLAFLFTPTGGFADQEQKPDAHNQSERPTGSNAQASETKSKNGPPWKETPRVDAAAIVSPAQASLQRLRLVAKNAEVTSIIASKPSPIAVIDGESYRIGDKLEASIDFTVSAIDTTTKVVTFSDSFGNTATCAMR